MQAGLEEFEAHGFAKASLARIAKAAGVSRATLYLYFDNKEALFLAVANQVMDGILDEEAERLTTGDGDTESTLRAVLQVFYAAMTQRRHGVLLRILVSEGPSLPDLVARYHAEILNRGRKLLEGIVARGIKQGELRQSAATEIPQLLVAPAMFYAIHMLVFSEHETLDMEAYLNGHIDMAMNGIRAERG